MTKEEKALLIEVTLRLLPLLIRPDQKRLEKLLEDMEQADRIRGAGDIPC